MSRSEWWSVSQHDEAGPIPADQLRNRLAALSASVDQLPDLANPPETTLSILGEARTEAHWEAFFTYFLDTDAPHGFGTDLLEAFLTALSRHSTSTLDPPAYQLPEIRIESQIGADDGVPDILLWVPNEWFCCIELKAHSGESDDQTVRYADSAKLGSLTVGDFAEENRHYVYLAPESKPDPASEEFARLAWQDVVPSFTEILSTSRGRYPEKSRAQFADFVDTLQDELAMTEYSKYEREKVALAIEYGPEIDTVQSALQSFVEEELTNWEADFASVAPDGWDTELGGQIYPRMIHDQWRFDHSGPVATDEAAEMALIYESQINEESLLNRDLTISFQRRTGSDETLEQLVYDALYASDIQAEFRQLAAEHDLTLFDRRDGVTVFETPVSLDIGRGDTIGEQFAARIRELEPVTSVVHEAIADIEWE